MCDAYSMCFAWGPIEIDRANEQQDYHDSDMTSKRMQGNIAKEHVTMV